MTQDMLKSIASKVAIAGGSWIASRYHLSGDQVSAILTDAGTVAAAAYGIYHTYTLSTAKEATS